MRLKFELLLVFLVLLAHAADAQERPARFEVGPVFSVYYNPNSFTTPQSELGSRFTWNWLPHLALEGEYGSALKYPGSATEFEGGYFTHGLFGVKSSIRWRTWGVFAKFRPGFIRYSSVITGATITPTSISFTRGALRNAAFDLGGGAEFFISRHFLFRYEVGDTIVHEGPRPFFQNGQELIILAFTHNHFAAEAGLAFRF